MTAGVVTDHVAGTLSLLDKEVLRYVPAGGNWRDLPDDFPSARVKQIRESAARGEGSRSTYYGRLGWDKPSQGYPSEPTSFRQGVSRQGRLARGRSKLGG